MGPTSAIAALILGGAALLWLGARTLEQMLLYHPDTRPASPSDFGLNGFQEHRLARPDGAEIVIWVGGPHDAETTIVYFHGNGGHVGGRAERLAAFVAVGHRVTIMAYRGYSGSTGRPSEAANKSDALAVVDWVKTTTKHPRPLILYGESLGTGIAMSVAARSAVSGVILEAPYTSIAEVGSRVYPFLPVKLVMRDRYDTRAYLDRVTVPVLIVHGDQDELIPIDMAREIVAALGPQARLIEVAGAGHNDVYRSGAFGHVLDWITAIEAASRGHEPGAQTR